MKKTYKYIALAALALGFTACSQDDDFAPQQEDVVKIASANIASEVQSRVNTLDEGTAWETGDQILLVNNSTTNKNNGTYEATVTTGDNTTWAPTKGVVLYSSSGKNNFTAYYPASATFTLPTDQSTAEGIKSADRMVATAADVAKGAAVVLSFERQNAKVTVIPHFNTEFDPSSAVISSLKIASVITPYYSQNAQDYTAIIEPSANGFAVEVKVKVGDNESQLTATTSTKIEAGKHYTFDLTVGKVAVSIAAPSVSQWNENGVIYMETEELPTSPYVNATSLTSPQLETNLTASLNSTDYDDITVALADNAGIDMFNAITKAIKSANNVNSASLNLTIVGVKTIPANAFGNSDTESLEASGKLKTLNLSDAVTLETNALCLPNVEAIYLPKVTEWKGDAIKNKNNSLRTLVLTAQGTITGNPNFKFCLRHPSI